MWQRPSVRLCRPASLRDCVVDRVRCVQRRGVVILESLMVLLILVIGLLAVIEWSVVMLTHCGVTSAAAEGARVAARSVFVTSRQADTELAVQSILSAHGVAAVGAGGSVSVVLTDLGSSVRVTVTVPVLNTGIPGLLGTLGFSLSANSLQVSALASET